MVHETTKKEIAWVAFLADLPWQQAYVIYDGIVYSWGLGMNINIAMALTTKANYDKNFRLAGYSNMPVEKVNWERTKMLVKVLNFEWNGEYVKRTISTPVLPSYSVMKYLDNFFIIQPTWRRPRNAGLNLSPRGKK